MKKSLIALAVLAASGAAMAQSSVTLYGVADVALAKSKDSSAALINGGVLGSRWGVKGTEDLGGGLSAKFDLQQRLDLTTGSASGFKYAWVGLAGGFGEVQLGSVGSAYDDIAGATSPLFDSVLTTNIIAPTYSYEDPLNRAVKYITPEFGGFSAAVSTQFKDTGDANKRATSFNVGYTGGPLYVALGYEQQKNDAGLDSKQTRVVGSYDFGAAKLLASVGDKKDVATDLTIGVDVPLGAALTLSAGYTVADYDAGGDKGQAVGLALAYSLSKRTVLYTGFNKLNDEAVAASGNAEHTFALGIKHSF
ncbi:MAG TPA: porin [Comamonadaceae bacterium]|nr:porin [Comamonadaceae bacterium]